jgi:hypothetical protein
MDVIAALRPGGHLAPTDAMGCDRRPSSPFVGVVLRYAVGKDGSSAIAELLESQFGGQQKTGRRRSATWCEFSSSCRHGTNALGGVPLGVLLK